MHQFIAYESQFDVWIPDHWIAYSGNPYKLLPISDTNINMIKATRIVDDALSILSRGNEL